MNRVLASLISTLLVAFRSRPALQAEILALRHQLNVLRRFAGARRQLRSSDRVLWVWLSRLWSEWREGLATVKPGRRGVARCLASGILARLTTSLWRNPRLFRARYTEDAQLADFGCRLCGKALGAKLAATRSCDFWSEWTDGP